MYIRLTHIQYGELCALELNYPYLSRFLYQMRYEERIQRWVLEVSPFLFYSFLTYLQEHEPFNLLTDALVNLGKEQDVDFWKKTYSVSNYRRPP